MLVLFFQITVGIHTQRRLSGSLAKFLTQVRRSRLGDRSYRRRAIDPTVQLFRRDNHAFAIIKGRHRGPSPTGVAIRRLLLQKTRNELRYYKPYNVLYYTGSTAGCVVEEGTQKIAETDCFAQIVDTVAALPVDPHILQRKEAAIPDCFHYLYGPREIDCVVPE